jgi:microsomal dipeptidase-like Zn-dependent dipeptidase
VGAAAEKRMSKRFFYSKFLTMKKLQFIIFLYFLLFVNLANSQIIYPFPLSFLNIATVYPDANFGGTSINIIGVSRSTLSQLGVSSVGSIKVAWGYQAILTYGVSRQITNPMTGRVTVISSEQQLVIVGDREGDLPVGITSIEIVEYTPLNGWVDMHTHPASQDAFGGEFFFGGIDGNISQALGNCSCSHAFPQFPDNIPIAGGLPVPVVTGCYNFIRKRLVQPYEQHSVWEGYPNFSNWPNHNSKLHQQMWWEWIDRARRGGQRVMVALAHNSQCLADASESARTPIDDKGSMLAQIATIKRMVANHPTIMAIARNAAQMRSIVQSGRLAIILGVEMDNIGNFYNPAFRAGNVAYNPNPTNQDIINEIDELWRNDIRYIFPIHITNNVFGGAALYGSASEKLLFNVSNNYNTGARFNVEPSDSTAWKALGWRNALGNRDAGDIEATNKLNELYGLCRNDFIPDFIPCQLINPYQYDYGEYVRLNNASGHRNALGLTDRGRFAVRYMMRKGMLIDIDHMSDKAADETINIALENNYPVNAGHVIPRGEDASINAGGERTKSNRQLRQIIQTGGMIGSGHGGEASIFARLLGNLAQLTGYKNIAFGTDVNIDVLPAAPATDSGRLVSNPIGLSDLTTGNKTWNFATYNSDGVSHYGLMPEYVQSVMQACSSRTVANTLWRGTEYFAQMWEKCERQRTNIH